MTAGSRLFIRPIRLIGPAFILMADGVLVIIIIVLNLVMMRVAQFTSSCRK